MRNRQHHFISINQITLHVVTAGPDDGIPVLLLHGFPEFWYGWQHQIRYLSEKGYRLIVPDQRGYNRSDKPKGFCNYHLDYLVDDVIGLIDYFGYDQVYLAGHDWGAVVSWWLATKYPHRLKKLAILNVPYTSVIKKAIMGGYVKQIFKSWYVLFFQLPVLPELVIRLSSRNTPFLLDMSSDASTFAAEDKVAYLRAWRQPGALTGMVNWYRALRLSMGGMPAPRAGLIETPTLILWGERDIALGKVLAEMSVEVCKNGRLIFFPSATHWVQHDEADAVNVYLHTFFCEEA